MTSPETPETPETSASLPETSASLSLRSGRTRPRSLLCLNMIVRNEVAILERCLASVAPHIGAYVIVDTGSTDGTPALIESFFAERGIPGEIHHVPFVDFAQARNAALDAAHASPLPFEHLLLADADMELQVDAGAEDWVTRLTFPGHHLPQQSDHLRYDNARLLARTAPARYVGKTHEYLAVTPPLGDAIPGVWFLDHCNGSNRPEKYTRDVRLLTASLAENPHDGRAMFYLAQTYKDMGRTADALRWYQAREAAGGWDEEVWYSVYQQAACHKDMGNPQAFTATALRAFQMRPTRPEPLHLLASYHRHRGENALAVLYARMGMDLPLPSDKLFVEMYPTRWGFREEMAIAGFYSPFPSVRMLAQEACQALARERSAPEGTRNLARSNLVHYARSLTELVGGSAIKLDVKPWSDETAHGDPNRPRWSAGSPSVAWLAPQDGGFAPEPPPRARRSEGRTSLEAARGPRLFLPEPPPRARRSEGRTSPEAARGPRLACAFRWHNYHFADGAYHSHDGDGVVRTETDILVLDPLSLEIRERKPIREACDVPRTDFHVRGFEDLRLFADPITGNTFATATARDLSSDSHAEIVLLTLAETLDAWEILAAQVLPRVTPGAYEKNWMPVLEQGSAPRFLAHVDPPTVLALEPWGPNGPNATTVAAAHFTVDAPLTVLLDDARGGGQVLDLRGALSTLPLPDPRITFLGIVHRAQTAADQTRSYTHAFVGFDAQLRAIAESPPFHLQAPGLEFATGLAIPIGIDPLAELLIGYHFRDREAWVHRAPLAAVLEHLSLFPKETL